MKQSVPNGNKKCPYSLNIMTNYAESVDPNTKPRFGCNGFLEVPRRRSCLTSSIRAQIPIHAGV